MHGLSSRSGPAQGGSAVSAMSQTMQWEHVHCEHTSTWAKEEATTGDPRAHMHLVELWSLRISSLQVL